MDTYGKNFTRAIRENFDASAEHYEEFEEEYHFFENLAMKQCELMDISRVRRVLDVGCGTGISTDSISKNFGVNCSYYGIDISENMLNIAKKRFLKEDNFVFVQGDAENLKDYFLETFDAIFYTASLFLIPNFKKSLNGAFDLIKEGKKVSISFYSGITDVNGVDLVKKLFPGYKYVYGAYTFEKLLDFLSEKGVKHFITDYHFPVDLECLINFLSIPAQAMGLFPRQPHQKQKFLIKEFVEDLFAMEEEVYMKWTFLIATK